MPLVRLETHRLGLRQVLAHRASSLDPGNLCKQFVRHADKVQHFVGKIWILTVLHFYAKSDPFQLSSLLLVKVVESTKFDSKWFVSTSGPTFLLKMSYERSYVDCLRFRQSVMNWGPKLFTSVIGVFILLGFNGHQVQ